MVKKLVILFLIFNDDTNNMPYKMQCIMKSTRSKECYLVRKG